MQKFNKGKYSKLTMLSIFIIISSCSYNSQREQRNNTKVFDDVSYELLSKYMFLLFYTPAPFSKDIINIFKNKEDSLIQKELMQTFKPFDFSKLTATNEYEFADFFSEKQYSLLYGKKTILTTDTLYFIDDLTLAHIKRQIAAEFSEYNIKSKNKSIFYEYNMFSSYEYRFLNKAEVDTLQGFINIGGELFLSNIFYNTNKTKAFFICDYKYEPFFSIKEIILLKKKECYWKIDDRIVIDGHNYKIE